MRAPHSPSESMYSAAQPLAFHRQSRGFCTPPAQHPGSEMLLSQVQGRVRCIIKPLPEHGVLGVNATEQPTGKKTRLGEFTA